MQVTVWIRAQPQPELEPELPPAAVVSITGHPVDNVLALERLVEQRAAEFPDRAEEALRGRLPA